MRNTHPSPLRYSRRFLGKRVERGYEMRSAGPDGDADTPDDIVTVNSQFTQGPGTQ